MQTLVTSDRKAWIDNLRWITILIVVVFHIFFFYNNIDINPMFDKLGPNTSPVIPGTKPVEYASQVLPFSQWTFAGVFQYAVYQWFMLLLFVVSGICAKYTLQTKTVREFLRNRVTKLLVPSTLGVICVHWIAGWLESSMFMPADVPVVVKIIVSILSGTGGLWFCHVLIVACLMLALVKKIDKNSKLEALGEKSNLLVAVLLYFVMLGEAQVSNVPMVTTYRMAYYPMGFMLGYYVFSSEKLLAKLKKFGWIFLLAGIISGVFYIKKFYGIYYANYTVLNNWLSILHAWLMTLGILGIAQNVLNFENKFSKYMTSSCWGIYINHITLMIVINYFLIPYTSNLSIYVIYLIELCGSLLLSIALWELFKRVPFLRYVLYGIKGKKKNA